VEKVAWLWRIVQIHGFHELLQDIQGGESTDAPSVKAEQAEVLVHRVPIEALAKEGSDHMRSEREACIDYCFTLKCAPLR
jgi:hypothetical protein